MTFLQEPDYDSGGSVRHYCSLMSLVEHRTDSFCFFQVRGLVIVNNGSAPDRPREGQPDLGFHRLRGENLGTEASRAVFAGRRARTIRE